MLYVKKKAGKKEGKEVRGKRKEMLVDKGEKKEGKKKVRYKGKKVGEV